MASVPVPADATDKSGLRGALEDGTPHDRLGGFGSGMAYLGNDRYALLADRGPKDGTTSFHCRYHTAEITYVPDSPTSLRFQLLSTTLFTAGTGRPLIGIAMALDAKRSRALRFDPEAIVAAPSGLFYVAEEYRPSIAEFDRSGSLLRPLRIPDGFKIKSPAATEQEELAANRSGRWPNRGFEGLALSIDGRKIYAALQSPLIQDGGTDALDVRLLEIELATYNSKQYVYRLDNKKYGISEILALRDNELLVLERDSKEGTAARSKKIYRASLANAQDVSSLESIADSGGNSIRVVRKDLAIDLLDPRYGLAGPQMAAKIEGLAFGPALPDGSRLLLVASDNDFRDDMPTWIYAFSFPAP